jgi:cytochrome c-type biogenesis protein CcmH/NrfF
MLERRRGTALVLASVAMMSSPVAAEGQVPTGLEGPFQPHAEAEAAISRLKSPFCPGLMLEVCPSPPAAVLRDSIQILAAEGWSRDSLVAWVVNSYGQEYLALPEARGKGLLAWAIPPLALLLGLGVVAGVLWRVRGRRVGQDVRPAAALSEEDSERLGAALRELEASEEVV